jgi:hypothetical protein
MEETMHNLAELDDRAFVSAELRCCRVISAERGRLRVADGGQQMEAGRAAGCLLAPVPGDEVLVALTSDGRALVTTVLEREEGGGGRLELDGDLELRAARGRVEITARDGVSLRSPRSIALAAAELRLTADLGRVLVRRLSLAGRLASAAWDQVKLSARSADTVVDRALQRFKIRSSRVEQLDQQQARMLHQTVDEVHAVQSGHTVMRARHEIRMDGKQIIVG